MRCPFCDIFSPVIKAWKKETLDTHLIITKDKENHVHVHGPMEDQGMLIEFIRIICKEGGIDLNKYLDKPDFDDKDQLISFIKEKCEEKNIHPSELVRVNVFDTGIGGDYEVSFMD